jgi:hypothetical protein
MKPLPITVLICCGAVLAGSTGLLDDTLDISVGQYRYVSFRVQPSQADSAFISGSVSITPDTASLEILLFHIDDFIRWRRSGADTDTLCHARSRSGEVGMPVGDCGDYYLVLSNRGNMSPVRVDARFDLVFRGSGAEYDTLKVALDLALVLMVAAAVIALILWVSGIGKGRGRRGAAG